MRSVWRRLAVAFAAALIVTLAVPLPAAAVRTVGVSQGTFDFSLAAGQQGTGELYVTNSGDEDLRVLIYAADQIVDAEGDVTYQVPNRDNGGVLGTPASWVNMRIQAETKTFGNTPYVEMAPGESIPVAFDITVPPNTAPGDHQVLLFFEMTGGSTEGSNSTSVSGRVGARLRVRVAGEVVERVEVRPFASRSLMIGKLNPYTFVIRNSGNVDKRIDARLVLLDGDLQEVYASDVATGTTVYAGTNQEFGGVLETDRQLLGKYTLRLELSYPREGAEVAIPETVNIDKTVWVVPLWLVIAVVVIVGGGAAWMSWRQSQKAAKRKAEARRAARQRARLEQSQAALRDE